MKKKLIPTLLVSIAMSFAQVTQVCSTFELHNRDKKFMKSYFLKSLCSILLFILMLPADAGNKAAFIDLMPEFFAAVNKQTSGAKGDQSVFNFFDAHKELYKQVLLSNYLTPAEVEKHLVDIGPLLPGMRSSYPELKSALTKRLPQLAKKYDFQFKGDDLYLWPSFFSSNGQLREYDGKMRVFFGLDVVAYVGDKYKNYQVLVDHEVFHLVHSRKNPAANKMLHEVYDREHLCPLYENLWVEGLASYASHLGNPEADLKEILFSEDVANLKNAEVQLAKEYLQNLELKDPKYLIRYFWMNREPSDIPQRSAYYMGFRVVSLVAERYSLEQMMMFDSEKILAEVKGALEKLRSNS